MRVLSGIDLRVVGWPLHPAVPAPVVVGPVAVVFLVGLVVLLAVGHQVLKREPVVAGDEVDAGIRSAAVVLVQVAGAGQPGRQFAGEAAVTLPERAHAVSVDAVPLGPAHREVPHHVAAGAHVPRLGDQFHLRQHRVLVDDVEERPQPVHLVKLPGQGARQVEPEPVDVHLRGPVPQAVHHQLQHPRMAHVRHVAAAREVHVIARVLGRKHVVRRVVHPSPGERRPQLVPLGRVVVHHVQNHLDPRRMQTPDHRLELLNGVQGVVRRRVSGIRREEPQGVVTPVVDQSPFFEEPVVDVIMHRQQLDRRHPQRFQVPQNRLARHAQVGSPEPLGHLGMPLREALDMCLVYQRLVPRSVRRPVVAPGECRVDHPPQRSERSTISVIFLKIVLAHRIGEQRVIPLQIAPISLA